MSLYTPRAFAGSPAAAERLMREHPFATLITALDGAEPHVTHLPLLLEQGVLLGHLARANPHWQAFAAGRTVAVFHGPHNYISPRWYVEPDQHVPTWNYASVHVAGRPQLLEAEAAAATLLRLTQAFERGAWTPQPERLARLLPGIVAFRLEPERIDVKLKMSQNRTPEDRARLREVLAGSARADDRAVADWITIAP